MLEVSGLTLRYSGQTKNALDTVNLRLAPGEIVLVSGPTGCGKSTLGLILCGAIPSLIPGRMSGSAVLLGVSIAGSPVHEIARTLGFLMQNVEQQMFTELVEDEIAFGLENFCVPAVEISRRTKEALALVKADHLAGRRLAELSAGERQRVMLAALLALQQQVLVLDEPLAYLDRTAQEQLLELLAHLARQGCAVLLFEHRRDMIRATVAHREIYLEQGLMAEAPAARWQFKKVLARLPGPEVLCFEQASFAWQADSPPLFQDFSFRLRQRESAVLLGRNGSGKTSLMALAAGLLRPQAGQVTVCGLNAATAAPQVIARQAAFIFQHPDHQLFLPAVSEEVRSQAADSATAEAELAALGLKDLEDRHPRSLSMGQKRRLTIAAALARQPRLLLLDEPSVGQDDRNLDRIIRRLDRFLEQGGALLTATHDERVAEALAGRIIPFPGAAAAAADAGQCRMTA